MESFKIFLEKKGPCWDGYKKVKGKADYAPGSCEKEETDLEEKKKGLWANIHAKRKRGERPAKPGEEGYPKTLDIDEVAANAVGHGGIDMNTNGKKNIKMPIMTRDRRDRYSLNKIYKMSIGQK